MEWTPWALEHPLIVLLGTYVFGIIMGIGFKR